MPCLYLCHLIVAEEWSRRHSVFTDPGGVVEQFSRRMARQDMELKPEQRAQLLQIYTEDLRTPRPS